jgi:hypothetical protein
MAKPAVVAPVEEGASTPEYDEEDMEAINAVCARNGQTPVSRETNWGEKWHIQQCHQSYQPQQRPILVRSAVSILQKERWDICRKIVIRQERLELQCLMLKTRNYNSEMSAIQTNQAVNHLN